MDPKEYGHKTWADLWAEIRADEQARKAEEEFRRILNQQLQRSAPEKGEDRGIGR